MLGCLLFLYSFLCAQEHVMPFKRIMIFGRPGSGKSTFSYHLHKKTGTPLYHIDKIIYQAGWVERDQQEFLKDLQTCIDQPEWIIDGNGKASIEKRYPHADIVLYFRMPRYLCYWRVLKRYFTKDRRIDDRAQGCPEIIWWKLITYMWNFEKIFNPTIEQCKKLYPTIPFVEITNEQEFQAVKKMFGLTYFVR